MEQDNNELGNTKFWFCIIAMIFIVALPLAILWSGWYVYEICFSIGLAALIGGIIGGCLGYSKFYRPSMEEADKIVRQMKELKGE